jgi:hypothetical protein
MPRGGKAALLFAAVLLAAGSCIALAQQGDDEDAKLVYARVFNSQSAQPCSLMPRFGYHKVLTEKQIRDVLAYLMSPDSPVNK